MRLQTESEFRQSEIKKLNNKYNIQIFSSYVHGGKAYAAKQKIREFKKLIFLSKQLHKATSTKPFDSRKLIRFLAENVTSIKSQKYGYAPNKTEGKAAAKERF